MDEEPEGHRALLQPINKRERSVNGPLSLWFSDASHESLVLTWPPQSTPALPTPTLEGLERKETK
jgi:hypothetical protein